AKDSAISFAVLRLVTEGSCGAALEEGRGVGCATLRLLTHRVEHVWHSLEPGGLLANQACIRLLQRTLALRGENGVHVEAHVNREVPAVHPGEPGVCLDETHQIGRAHV